MDNRPAPNAQARGRVAETNQPRQGTELQNNGSDQESSNGEYTESSGGSSDEELSWIAWYCSFSGNEFFCEVDQEWILDRFNLTGLSEQVSHYKAAIDMILDSDMDELGEEETEAIEQEASLLYGLIHARYILTTRGMLQMAEKYRNGDFGTCPRTLCANQHVLPVGLSGNPGEAVVKLFCPRCEEVYNTKSNRHQHLDGAYFTTTFAHLLLLLYPELRPIDQPEKYVPRIFGFKIHPSAYTFGEKQAQLQQKKQAHDRQEKERERQEQQLLAIRNSISSPHQTRNL